MLDEYEVLEFVASPWPASVMSGQSYCLKFLLRRTDGCRIGLQGRAGWMASLLIPRDLGKCHCHAPLRMPCQRQAVGVMKVWRSSAAEDMQARELMRLIRL